jgi:hypothetical protein
MRKNLIVNFVLIFHNVSKNIKLANDSMVQVMGLMQEQCVLNNMNFESSPISAMNHYITWHYVFTYLGNQFFQCRTIF